VLLLAAMAAGAQADNSAQGGQPPVSPPADSAPPTSTTISPDITVAAPRSEQTLPPLKPDEFINCSAMNRSASAEGGVDLIGMATCEHQLVGERRVVIEACVNPKGDTPLPRVIQACTELLDRNIFERYERFAVFLNRAHAYLAEGDTPHALDDYNEAVTVSPHNAQVFYDRGVFYAAQSDDDAALRDFATALGFNAKLVPALRQRAKIYLTRGNLSGALADYSEAIRWQPKTAALWSGRGYVCLRQHDNDGAVKDEAQAIKLDPTLAVAYFFRGAAFGGLHDSGNAVSDLKSAVSIDPSLARYVITKDKTASLTLPPPP
jgi:Tfp pilus assembly protein PilF